VLPPCSLLKRRCREGACREHGGAWGSTGEHGVAGGSREGAEREQRGSKTTK